MVKLSDTSPDAQRVLTLAYRQQSLAAKWLRLGAMYRDARFLHAVGVRLRQPGADERVVLSSWLTLNLGFPNLRPSRQPAETTTVEFLRETRELVRILDRLGITYALSGSVASSIFGIDRYTRDADLAVEPFAGKVVEFVQAFGPEYYVSEIAVRDAVTNRSTFNVINTSTGFKADFFVRKDVPFELSAMCRRTRLSLPDDPSQAISIYTAEDILLFKLRWYRLGGEVSEQQWTDVLGILRAQGERVDSDYLEHWAAELQISDLVARARAEAAI
jgi:hypothetical protein